MKRVERRLPPRLLALSPGTVGDESALDTFRRQLRRATDAGLRGVLLREPALHDRELLALGEFARAAGISWIGIHDRLHLAADGRFEGAHVGSRSLPPTVARAVIPATVTLGVSTHEGDAPELVAPADYAFFGPVFATDSKGTPLPGVGREALQRAIARFPGPLWALGGIDAWNAAELCTVAGLGGIAVRGAIFAAADPARAVERFLAVEAWRER